MPNLRALVLLSSTLGALLLAGCGGGSAESPSAGSPPDDRPPASGTALVSWYPPTERTDGSPLVDLAGYRVYFGKDPNPVRYTIEVTNPGQTSQFIDDLDQGTWYFSVTAYDRKGFESAKSAPASKTIG